MHVSCRLHIGQDVILQVADGLQRVRDVLVLLNVTYDICGFGAFGEVDEIRLLDNGRYAVFDEGKVR